MSIRISKWKILFFTSSALFVGGLLYLVIKNVKIDNFKKEENTQNEKFDSLDKISIFPSIDEKFLEAIVEKDVFGVSVLNDKLIDKIVKSILSRLNSFRGEIYFDYEINYNDLMLTIYFKHIENNEIKELKSYEIRF
ncbi:hypothetical protein MCANUFG1_03250 [Mycoplasmopsis canis UFG1]|uniref:Uncharacterized protein n=1 Tax=Mycoplasmopsis canis TaxID=29555 RepID=A0A449ARA1_9BACT|nr:hypothetical protein [Mycoplasmopsis canis]AMD81438.1 hypothetical protein AXW82_02680 [Mycoplasmopsis canis PG 14]EIE39541.1 hypothetical protein MCANPG14_03345 [Mycoplasmopsis canis PG 14]EIE41331.1 hypothetical protein MCANUFG1_03250 [Mycoplasmopsis canis UFG1]VEU69068.1 Uncharacterised protein [Mycoplasmopsis canis]